MASHFLLFFTRLKFRGLGRRSFPFPVYWKFCVLHLVFENLVKILRQETKISTVLSPPRFSWFCLLILLLFLQLLDTLWLRKYSIRFPSHFWLLGNISKISRKMDFLGVKLSGTQNRAFFLRHKYWWIGPDFEIFNSNLVSRANLQWCIGKPWLFIDCIDNSNIFLTNSETLYLKSLLGCTFWQIFGKRFLAAIILD